MFFLRRRRLLASVYTRCSSTKPYYITTPIFYPNAPPHIGHLSSLLTADIFARFQRLLEPQRKIVFLAGTDEHGLKIQKAALAAGENELAFVTKLAQRFMDLADTAQISYTTFMRTTREDHTTAVQSVWRTLNDQGLIYKSNYAGWYSVTDECFYTDQQVTKAPLSDAPTSPPGATSSTSTFSSETYRVFATETGSPVEWNHEENYMFRLSAFRQQLLAEYTRSTKASTTEPSEAGSTENPEAGTTLRKYTSDPPRIIPMQHLAHMIAILSENGGASLSSSPSSSAAATSPSLTSTIPLSPTSTSPPSDSAHCFTTLTPPIPGDLSISRPRTRLSWGVPVPDDPEHTVYVWFDALLVYLSGVGYPWVKVGTESISRGKLEESAIAHAWPPDLQVIGKDILRFHAHYLPAILTALGLPLATQILAHAHWTVEGHKMSKSIGNVVDPFAAMRTEGVDIVRFYLARVGGRWKDDVDWSQEQLTKHSKEIQSLLGNYFLRITSQKIYTALAMSPPLTYRALVASLPPSPHPSHPLYPIHALSCSLATLPQSVRTSLLTHAPSTALEHITSHLRLANKALTQLEPWARSTSPETVRACWLSAMETLRVVGVCLQPFLPGVAGRLLDALGVEEGERGWDMLEDLGDGKGVDCKAKNEADRVWGQVKGVRLFGLPP